MRKNQFLLGLLFLPWISTAGTLQCSDALGKWVYRVWTYDGGAAPNPCMITYRKYWGYDGMQLERITGTPENPGAGGDIMDNIDPRTASILETHGDMWSGGHTFAQKVKIFRKSGAPIAEGLEEKAMDIYLICSDNWQKGAP